ncbi:MAG: hypothetical protein H6Q71_2426 [Firmicutes bacterium]|nr:hypothetical protein [Bacillota bacterium]
MKRNLKIITVLCLLLIGVLGSTAYAADLDWKTTSVNVDDGLLYIGGYFTNNRADRVVNQINWFQPNITFTLIDGNVITLTERDATPIAVWIEPGCTYEAIFTISPPGDVWRNWKTKSTFNYNFEKIQG